MVQEVGQVQLVRRLRTTWHLSFTPDGERIIALARNLVMWDVSAAKRLHVAKPLSNMSSVAFSRSGDCLAVKNTSGQIAVLAASDLSVRAGPVDDGHGEGSAILAGVEPDTFVVPSWSGHVSLRSSSLDTVSETTLAPGMLRSVAIDDGTTMWAILRSVRAFGEIAVTESLFEVAPDTVPLPGMSIQQVELTSDNQAVITYRPREPTIQTPAGDLPSSTVIAWIDLATGSVRRSVLWAGVLINNLAVSPDKQHVAATGFFASSAFRLQGEPARPALGLVAADGAAEVTAVELPADVGTTHSVDYSPDGSRLAVGTDVAGLVFQVD